MADLFHKPTFLYRYYDDEECLLYIGISKSALLRLTQHQYHHRWACKIVTIKLQRYKNREDALIAEYKAIVNEKPRHNVIICDPRIALWGTVDDI